MTKLSFFFVSFPDLKIFMSHQLFYEEVSGHFDETSGQTRTYSRSERRQKALYNSVKSQALTTLGMHSQAHVLDLGSGRGTDLLKYAKLQPGYVVLIDLSGGALESARDFAKSKNLRFQIGTLTRNVFEDPFSLETPLVEAPLQTIPRRIALKGRINLVTSFGLLNYCPTMTAMHHLCEQVARVLTPSQGLWVGTMTDENKVIRHSVHGTYTDRFCTIKAQKDGSYLWRGGGQTHPHRQFLWAPGTLVRVAKEFGLQVLRCESVLERAVQFDLGSSEGERFSTRELTPLSLMTLFIFSASTKST